MRIVLWEVHALGISVDQSISLYLSLLLSLSVSLFPSRIGPVPSARNLFPAGLGLFLVRMMTSGKRLGTPLYVLTLSRKSRQVPSLAPFRPFRTGLVRTGEETVLASPRSENTVAPTDG